MKTFNTVIAGVGGQGGLTLSRILADAAVRSGFSVRTGETLGMAQRGGSVQSFVRIGGNVRSPLFAAGAADVLIGLEALETARASSYLKDGGLVLADPTVKEPLTTLTHRETYPSPEILMHNLVVRGYDVHIIHASAEASKLGSPKSANAVLLGAFCSHTQFLPVNQVEASIKSVLVSRSAVALRAFRRGLEVAGKQAAPAQDSSS